jgi:two-component system LytT family response regulator
MEYSKTDLSADIQLIIKKIEILNRLVSNKTLALQTTEEVVLIHITDIIYCTSNINYTTIWLIENQKVVVAKTLGDIEKQINESSFFRIHQSCLINVLWLKQFKKGKGGYAIMIDNTKLDVSSRKKEAFLKFLTKTKT